MSSNINTKQVSNIKWLESMLCPILLGPMTNRGYPNETGRPMSCIETGYTVGEKTLHQLATHPKLGTPIDVTRWQINFTLESSIENFIKISIEQYKPPTYRVFH
jgi:hypothetical protein